MRWIYMIAAASIIVGGASAATINNEVTSTRPIAKAAVIMQSKSAMNTVSPYLKLVQNTGCADSPDYNSCTAGCQATFNYANTQCLFAGYSCMESAERDLVNCVTSCARTYC